MATTRIYVVHADGEAIALVRAVSQAAAIRHSTANRFAAIVADQDALIKHLGDGMKVEDAKAEAVA